ncbi:MAG: P27 family phage terminase small subunit [Syntrophorhabdaceae bacterium]|nr:P27 family phage terminase small subunit [Syntrophorhabdaceae bacterium]MDD5243089.1 P27 family phage terminase small subunit [Syntrophorhabdaceae bacterium]
MKKTALSKEAEKLRKSILSEYDISDSAGLQILNTALEAFDMMRDSQAQIKRDGLVITDRWGQSKAHPLCSVARDARAQFLQALKQLNLDLEPLRDAPGRPGGR